MKELYFAMSAGVQETALKRDDSPTRLIPSALGSGVALIGGGGDKERTSANKRQNKTSFSRTGSFRNRHKVKQQDSNDMSTGGRGRSPGDSRLWRIRHFGYYDIQAVNVDRLGYQVAQGDPQQRLKKHTGASAALLTVGDESNGDNNVLDEASEVGNDLVAVCPAFKNEIGGGDWLQDNVISKLRDYLSQDKKLRLCSRESVVMDGEFRESSNDKPVTTTTTEYNGIFTVQSGLTFPLEFIDHGACYYRQYFYDKG